MFIRCIPFFPVTNTHSHTHSLTQPSLMAVMTHIRDVRKRMSYMEHTFQPLRDMVMLLTTHGMKRLVGTAPRTEFERILGKELANASAASS